MGQVLKLSAQKIIDKEDQGIFLHLEGGKASSLQYLDETHVYQNDLGSGAGGRRRPRRQKDVER